MKQIKRRKFIQNLVWITGGLLTVGQLPARAFISNGKKIKGRILANGKPVKDVVVSDGYSVVVTDKKGKYEIDPHVAATNIFISTPAGYEFIQQQNIARH